MITVVDGKIVDSYDEFVKCDFSLPYKITKLTGIDDETLDEKGLDEKQVAFDLKAQLQDDALMIAHNAQFDLSFIYFLLLRHFPDEADDLVKKMDWLDTLTVLKDRKKYPHKLIDAVDHYGIEKVNFHRAIDDTKALYNVYKKLKEERDDLSEYINVFGFNPKYGISGKRFEFIDYKSQSFHNFMVDEDNILPKK